MNASGSSPSHSPSDPDPVPDVGLSSAARESLVRAVDSEQLFAGHNEIRVRHRGEEYRLRITRQGKLILTK